MAHGASTTDECPLEGCGGTIVGYWSEHEREDGTTCPFGPDHPAWEKWNAARIVCQDCGEPGDRPGDPLEYDNDQGTWRHPGCWADCWLCDEPLDNGDDWATYDQPFEMHAHTACYAKDYGAD